MLTVWVCKRLLTDLFQWTRSFWWAAFSFRFSCCASWIVPKANSTSVSSICIGIWGWRQCTQSSSVSLRRLWSILGPVPIGTMSIFCQTPVGSLGGDNSSTVSLKNISLLSLSKLFEYNTSFIASSVNNLFPLDPYHQVRNPTTTSVLFYLKNTRYFIVSVHRASVVSSGWHATVSFITSVHLSALALEKSWTCFPSLCCYDKLRNDIYRLCYLWSTSRLYTYPAVFMIFLFLCLLIKYLNLNRLIFLEII